MATKKVEKKPSLDEFLSFAPPKRTEYVTSNEPINVDGYIYEKKKKGVTQPQREPEVKAAPPVVEAAPTPAPVAPIAAPIKQGGDLPKPAMSVRSPEATMPAPAAEQTGVLGRALAGATPLLVGWLTGNTMEGAQASGKLITDTENDLTKRERDFHTKIAEMKATQALKPISGKGINAKTFEYVGSDKQVRIGRLVNGEYYRDEATDPIANPKATKDSWLSKTIDTPEGPKEVVYNPSTQETRSIGDHYAADKFAYKEVIHPGTKEPTLAAIQGDKITNYLGKTVPKGAAAVDREKGKDERQVKAIRVGLLKEITKPGSAYSKSRESMEGMARAAELLNDGGPVGASGLRMILARSVFGEKGPLSDGDISRLNGDPGASAVVSRVWDKFVEGKPLNEQDRRDVRTVIDIAGKLSQEDANRYLDGYIKTYDAEGYDLSPQLQNFREMPTIPAFKEGRRKGMTAAQRPTGPAAGVVEDGYKFKGGDPKDKANWEKQ